MKHCLRRVPPVALALALLTPTTALTQQGGEWVFGIGTGPQLLNAEGDVGFTSARGAERGSINLSPGDFNDLMESAFGFHSFAARGKWRLQLIYGNLALEDETEVSVRGLPPLRTTFQQDVEFGEFTVGYEVANLRGNRFGVLAGVRTTRHDYSLETAPPANSTAGALRRSLDDDWTDALVGLTHVLALSEKISLRSSAAAGFGGSDSYWFVRSVLGWQFARSWKAGLSFEYRGIDYENGDPGDSDWYLYDVNEFGPGLIITYVFQ